MCSPGRLVDRVRRNNPQGHLSTTTEETPERTSKSQPQIKKQNPGWRGNGLSATEGCVSTPETQLLVPHTTFIATTTTTGQRLERLHTPFVSKSRSKRATLNNNEPLLQESSSCATIRHRVACPHVSRRFPLISTSAPFRGFNEVPLSPRPSRTRR